MVTLDVGCGSRPIGDVNVDNLLIKESTHVFNVHSVPNFIIADACFLPFRDKMFSHVTCFHMMEHVYHDEQIYQEFNRVTHGTLEIRVPFGVWEDVVNTLFFWRDFKHWRKKHHVKRYTKQMLKHSCTSVFRDKHVKIMYGFLAFTQVLHFALFLFIKSWPYLKTLHRNPTVPFPFPYEIVAIITEKQKCCQLSL